MPIADIDYTEYFTPEALEKLQSQFDKSDSDGDSKINEAELATMMKKQGRNMTRHQVRDLLRSVDYNASGAIEFEELCVLEILLNDLKPRPELIDYRDFLQEPDIKRLEGQFIQQDFAQTGTIDFDAVCDAAEAMMWQTTAEQLHPLYKQVDPAGEGVEFPHFCALFAVAGHKRKKCNYREFLNREQVSSFRKLFECHAKKATDHISFQDMEQILRRIGLQVKKTQLQLIINSFDTDGSGDIDFEEFCVMMLRLKGLRRQEVISPVTHRCTQLWLQEEFSVKELQQSGFGLQHFREAGIPVGRLVQEGGISALELRRAGYSSLELRRGGLGAEELRYAGFSLAELRNAGFSDYVLRSANNGLKNCFSAGDLSPLPQRRPLSKEGKSGPVRGAVLINAGMTLGHAMWDLPQRPMTQMIREHTDWRPMLSRSPSKAWDFSKAPPQLASLCEGL